MAHERQNWIEAVAKERYPRKGYTRDAFIAGAMWADVSHWRPTQTERPEEGRVVFCAYNVWQEGDNLHASMNIATYKNGKFESFSNEEPVLWMYPPVFPSSGFKMEKTENK